MMKRKDDVVKALTGGVSFLFRKHKIETVIGDARIPAPGSVEATGAEDAGRAFHAHPTLAEAMKEAALAVDKAAIHI